MKKLTALFFTIFCLPALAYYEPASKVLPIKNRYKIMTIQEERVSVAAQKLVGLLSLSSQSLNYQMKDEALRDLENAEKEARKILKDSYGVSELKGIPLGKVTGAGENYYVPVWFADGVAEEIKESGFLRKKPKVLAASMVVITMSLNMPSTITHLQKARQAVKKNEWPAALMEMSAIMDETLVSETLLNDPIMSVWANLYLSYEFIRREDYRNARHTMKAARKDLSRLEKEKIITKDSDEMKALQFDLDVINETLDEKAPTILKRAKDRIRKWATKVKDWV